MSSFAASNEDPPAYAPDWEPEPLELPLVLPVAPPRRAPEEAPDGEHRHRVVVIDLS